MTVAPDISPRITAADRLRASRRSRSAAALVVFLLSAGAILGFAWWSYATWSSDLHHVGTVIGIVSLTYLGFKMWLSLRYRSHDAAAPAGLTTAVVIPAYNEDPVAFRACLASVLEQTRPADEVWVIDDASADDTCLRIAREMLAGHPGAHVIALPANEGKRHAQSRAFLASQADVFVTVDSDTVLDPAAIEEGLRPLADAQVMAVTGNVRVLNWSTNVLTRLTALRYANAFLWERAAYSRLDGSVLCCCGSLSFWRADLVRRHLDDYLTQTFLGVNVSFGDDRRLTNYALLSGKVVLQDTAVGYTAVPERWGHYVRQQTRWNKSFFRESWWVIRNARHIRRVWWLSVAEVGLWATAFFTLTARHSWNLLTAGQVSLFLIWFGSAMAYARSARFLGSQDMSPGQQWLTFFLAPLYWVMSVVLLVPLRFASLASMRSGAWGTRSAVEVRVTDGTAAAALTT